MPVPSRTTFYERLSAYRGALEEPAIVSQPPNEISHNAKARLFRNGLAVMGFAILEDFIRTRMAEILDRVGNGPTAFVDLPSALRRASTLGVVEGIKFTSNFLDSQSTAFYAHVQNHSQSVASTATAAYRISSLAFAADHPNVQGSDIENILLAFHINQPWTAIQTMSHRTGSGVISAREAFLAALTRRNMAAHQANSDIEFGELEAFSSVATAIAAGFDLMISHALRKILDGDVDFLNGTTKLAANHVGIRFISRGGNHWREVINGGQRAFRRHTDLNTLITECRGRAHTRGQAVVVKDESGRVAHWYTPVID